MMGLVLFSEKVHRVIVGVLRGIQLLYLLSTNITANIVAGLFSHDI